MSIVRTKKDQLVEEFHVQVYSSGRVEWDNLDIFIPKKSVAREHLKRAVLSRLQAGFGGHSQAA